MWIPRGSSGISSIISSGISSVISSGISSGKNLIMTKRLEPQTRVMQVSSLILTWCPGEYIDYSLWSDILETQFSEMVLVHSNLLSAYFMTSPVHLTLDPYYMELEEYYAIRDNSWSAG